MSHSLLSRPAACIQQQKCPRNMSQSGRNYSPWDLNQQREGDRGRREERRESAERNGNLGTAAARCCAMEHTAARELLGIRNEAEEKKEKKEGGSCDTKKIARIFVPCWRLPATQNLGQILRDSTKMCP